jgi:hypothetical protein
MYVHLKLRLPQQLILVNLVMKAFIPVLEAVPEFLNDNGHQNQTESLLESLHFSATKAQDYKIKEPYAKTFGLHPMIFCSGSITCHIFIAFKWARLLS